MGVRNRFLHHVSILSSRIFSKCLDLRMGSGIWGTDFRDRMLIVCLTWFWRLSLLSSRLEVSLFILKHFLSCFQLLDATQNWAAYLKWALHSCVLANRNRRMHQGSPLSTNRNVLAAQLRPLPVSLYLALGVIEVLKKQPSKKLSSRSRRSLYTGSRISFTFERLCVELVLL